MPKKKSKRKIGSKKIKTAFWLSLIKKEEFKLTPSLNKNRSPDIGKKMWHSHIKI